MSFFVLLVGSECTFGRKKKVEAKGAGEGRVSKYCTAAENLVSHSGLSRKSRGSEIARTPTSPRAAAPQGKKPGRSVLILPGLDLELLS